MVRNIINTLNCAFVVCQLTCQLVAYFIPVSVIAVVHHTRHTLSFRFGYSKAVSFATPSMGCLSHRGKHQGGLFGDGAKDNIR